MRIVLVRHGAAKRAGPYVDADRPLSNEGEADLERIARALARLRLQPSLVLTSPALRCKRTAEIVASALGDPPLRVENGLSVDGSTSKVFGALTRLGDPEEIVLVGHEPGLESLTSVLLAGDSLVQIRFRCGSTACLEVDSIPPSHPAILHWLLTPTQLRLIAGPSKSSRSHETAK